MKSRFRISLTLIGLLTGMLIWGWRGLLIGFFLGYLLDKKRKTWFKGYSEAPHSKWRRSKDETLFFQFTFQMLGYLAKADGHVSQQEVHAAEHIMSSMALSSDERLAAIAAFNAGKSRSQPPQEFFRPFKKRFKRRTGKKAEWLHYQFQMLYAQGQADTERVEQLGMSAFYAGITPEQFQNLRQQYRKAWQDNRQYTYQGRSKKDHSYNRQQRYSAQPSPGTALNDAYRLLGVTPDADIVAVKKAFRQKISKVHPDKLSGRAISPEDATRSKEAAQQLQAAYQLIKQSRRHF